MCFAEGARTNERVIHEYKSRPTTLLFEILSLVLKRCNMITFFISSMHTNVLLIYIKSTIHDCIFCFRAEIYVDDVHRNKLRTYVEYVGTRQSVTWRRPMVNYIQV